MALIHKLPEPVPTKSKGSVLALGNFDGLHAGHRAVIECARSLANGEGLSASIATFDPSPREHFAPGAPPHRILTPHRREILLDGIDIETCFLIPFDESIATMEPSAFVDEILVDALGARGVAIGFDFHFGKDRAGDASTLIELGKERGLLVGVVPEISDSYGKISSSRIRRTIASGNMQATRECLGDYWVVVAHVEHGEKRGRTLGFPTANLRPENLIHPDHGIYAIWARIEGINHWHAGVANFGRTPTTGLRDPLLEAVLFDFDADLYGKRLEVAYVERLRGEVAFDSVEQLTEQMKRDADQARVLLQTADKPRW